MVNPFGPRPVRSLLGLSLHGPSLHALAAARSNGGVKWLHSASATLSQDPLQGDPEEGGREIRRFLDREEIRERRCLLSFPPRLAMSLPLEVPDLSGEDLDSFLEIQAESELPYPAGSLCLAWEPWTGAGGARRGALFALPVDLRRRIEELLRHAGLIPASLVPGLAPPSLPEGTELVLQLRPGRADCQVVGEGGHALFRSLEDTGGLAREIRITLGQLSPELRGRLSRATVHHSPDLDPEALDRLEEGLRGMGLAAERIPGEHPALKASLSGFLQRQESPLEFLPPRRSPLEWLLEKTRSRRNAWVGGGVAAAASLALLAFLIQGWRLGSLERRWNAMEEKVAELETRQDRIRQFRPWNSDRPRSLEILDLLSSEFPRQGSLWARSLEIEADARVESEASARDWDTFLDLGDRLRKRPEIGNFSPGGRIREAEGSTTEAAFGFDWIPSPRP